MYLSRVFVIISCINFAFGVREINKCGKVHITISSHPAYYVELNWINKNCQPEDEFPFVIALYSDNPVKDLNSNKLLEIKAADYPDGYYRTRIKFNYERYKIGNNNFTFPFWAASINLDVELIHTQPLTTRPSWMGDHSEQLKNLRIGEMFIPGTHDAATSKAFWFSPYTKNQALPIAAQLLFGIRYVDLRVGYHKFRDTFTIQHELFEIQKLEPVLREIRNFIQRGSKEIVIVHFHRFPVPSRFTPDLHARVIQIIQNAFGELIFSRNGYDGTRGPTLQEMWNKGKNFIISYADEDTARANDFLWYEIPQQWANQNKMDPFRKFLEERIASHNDRLSWAIMAQLTPKIEDILTWRNTVAKMAQDVNPNITKWFRDEWSQSVAIVASDYFLGNDLINVAIEANLQKSQSTIP